ncbi:hypothetical protein AB205_0002640 [Aquarana catesbeiana]|uniref:t-SNARE coiled-coil homology domain-containing protein n=1 Tax=Aquarana catesbeiana TaxID=8400 RepID=A0A2G9RNG2_AQUCT|nr:hypothetical protein AB205_0002640 [Aquarana catesbeiana]
MQTRFCVRRGHSAAVYTSGCWSTSDRDVVEEECHFTSESAQILIGEIMGCNRDLENIKQNINDVQKKIKNIIDVLGRI